mgnify:CR=1 FL=1
MNKVITRTLQKPIKAANGILIVELISINTSAPFIWMVLDIHSVKLALHLGFEVCELHEDSTETLLEDMEQFNPDSKYAI